MPEHPNILFIFTDQHRLSAMGAYGDTPCHTPHLDRLAAEGTLFERAYTVYPVCSPARGTIQTGVYPHTHGITSNIHEIGCSVHELEDRPSLLPRRLQAAGYGCGYTGKWHLGSNKSEAFGAPNRPSLPSTIGYEGQDCPNHGGDGAGYPDYREWLAANGRVREVLPWSLSARRNRRCGVLKGTVESTVPYYLVDKTMETIGRFRERGTPFFMSLNFWGPHAPYQATEEFFDLYRDVEIPPWPNADWPAWNIPGPHQVKLAPRGEQMRWEDWETMLRFYYARMTMIDSQIGRLRDWLEAEGLLENTVLIFTADHGETIGSHGGLMDKGWHHFEETHRIPFLVRMPDGSGAGERRREFVSLADIYPTVLDLAGGEYAPDAVHGLSLAPLLRGEATEWRDSVVTEFCGLGNQGMTQRTIRHGDIKYGYNACCQDELYDLAADPHETLNRIDDPAYRDVADDMRGRLDAWMEATDDPAIRMWRWTRRPQASVLVDPPSAGRPDEPAFSL